MSVTLTYKGEIPVKKNTQRIGKHGGIYKAQKASDFEDQIGWEWRLTRQEPITGAFRIKSGYFCITARKDLDGCLTTLLDALQYAGAIENDKLLVEIGNVRKVSTQKGEIEHLIIELEGVE
jgi:Holliday junction resolvase RusA-like endonuclease